MKKNEEIVDYFKNFDCDTGNISELIKFLSEGPSLIIREDAERDDDDMWAFESKISSIKFFKIHFRINNAVADRNAGTILCLKKTCGTGKN